MAHEVSAVLHAIQPGSTAENTRQVKALSPWADGARQAEHIKEMVAVTMGHQSIDINAVIRKNAMKWQSWTLGLASDLDEMARA